MIVKLLPIPFDELQDKYNTRMLDSFWCSDKSAGQSLDMLFKEMFNSDKWLVSSGDHVEPSGVVRDFYWLSISPALEEEMKSIPGFIDIEYYPVAPVYENEIGARNNFRFLVDKGVKQDMQWMDKAYHAMVCWGSTNNNEPFTKEDFKIICITKRDEQDH